MVFLTRSAVLFFVVASFSCSAPQPTKNSAFFANSAASPVASSGNVIEEQLTRGLGVETSNPHRLVAVDLVSALTQAADQVVSEWVVTVRGDSLAAEAVRKLLGGYLGATLLHPREMTKTSEVLVSYSLASSYDINDAYVVSLQMGEIGVKRAYLIKEDFIAPISSLYVRGAPLSAVELNDLIFISR